MTSMIPMAMFGQEVPPGDVAIKAEGDIPAAFRITMAAIDPSAVPEGDEGQPLRATLKVIRQPLGMDDDDDYDSEDDEDDDEFDVDQMDAMLAGEDEEDDDEDEDLAGGPSDPAKSKKARVAAMIRKLAEQEGMDVDEDDEDDEDDAKPNGVNGIKSVKSMGKMPIGDDEDEDEDDDDLDSEDYVEEFVICTLDPEKNYQQPLDITIGEDERVFFKVSGTHAVYLTGNYVEPAASGPGMYDPDDDEDEDYDLEPDMDELDDDEEEDELDDMEDPRITEIDEEEVAPKLIEMATKKEKADSKKGNKRPADDEAQTLDEMIKDASTNGEAKLSKKQLKKMKKNDGTAAAVEDKSADAASSAKSDKKVQFAKELEQGPTPTKDNKVAEKPAAAAKKDKSTPTLGVKTVQGVTLDDKKLGTGPAAKAGDRVGMRYIGKLQKDNKVFDSNKKGKPFTFKLGAGEVIKGWDIGIQGMSIGGERRVTIPAHLAYGSKGAGRDIPPNSTLVFDVKLLELNKSK